MRWVTFTLGVIFFFLDSRTAPAQPAPPPPAPPQPAPAQPALRQQAPKGPAAGATEPDSATDDAKTLRAVGLGVDGPALLDYFRRHTFKEADPKKVTELIKDLANDEFPVREKAHAELLTLGSGALVGLKEAEKNPNTESRRRATELRQAIEAKAEPAIQAACVRQVARLNPAGAADVLLAYLPFADVNVIDDFAKALATVGLKDGKPEPGMIKALEDRLPLKRGVAGQALARSVAQQPAVRKLLKDADASVRLRVAMALVHSKDKEALPVLVDVLADLQPEQLWPVEEVLVRLAGEKAPGVSLGTNEISRKACRDAWASWLEQNKTKIDLAKLIEAPPHLNYTLLVHQKIALGRGASGQVVELDAARKPRWQFDVPTYPVDAQIVGPGRVLVTEFHGQRVSERDFKGEVKWQQQVPGNPISAQRLANGNTFVVMQNSLHEYNRKGEEVFNHQLPFIFRARKAKNGDIIYLTNSGQLVRLDGKTKQQLKSFQVGNPVNLFGGIEILANGHVVVPQFQTKQIVEYDANGKQVGNAIQVQEYPTSVARLPNGHTLVASMNNQQVAEYDRTGRQVWLYNAGGSVFNVRGR
jgi:outer membrane protein assembly factor BamB